MVDLPYNLREQVLQDEPNSSWVNKRCGLCVGGPILTFAHISSIIHRSNVNKLPKDWWKMEPKTLKKNLHSSKKLNDNSS
jgi:hypothetical protein